MKKNSVSLKEVLMLAARALSDAQVKDVTANSKLVVADVQESQTPRCQQQRNADFSGLSCTHDVRDIATCDA